MAKIIALQHIDREGPGLFEKVANERGIRTIVKRLDRGENLDCLEKDDLVLILGGPMGIKDISNPLYSWISKEIDIIKYAVKNNIRLIGVCFGAQLIAYALNGKIERLLADDHPIPKPEIGWGKVFLNESSLKPVFKPYFSDELKVLHWHGDRIVLPKKAELIASSNRCREQFFKFNNLTYGLQFHLEVTNEMVLRWIKEDEKFIKLGLGEEADLLIREQLKRHGNSSFNSRLKLIQKIFDLILN